MILPEAVRRRVEARFGAVRGARPVGGGCINPALRLELPDGPAFLKYNGDAPAGLFPAEARALAALRAAAGPELRVPEVCAAFDAGEEGAPGEPGWILMEWIEPGPRGAGFDERLGRGLAALHRRAAEPWGWEEDNFIGPLPQANAAAPTWAEFWRDRRLEPQLRHAREAGYAGDAREWERLLAGLPDLLAAAEEDAPSLLHGDLWGGNLLASAAGEPCLVDPAAYRGHREVDLAMSELFGGFPPRFRAAYEEARPLLPGYREGRRAAYQLYYLLVHVVLFGGGYVARTRAALREALAGP
ncbi:MAG TPA: fructosamine kinase family protein [Longimicrobiaceae bacterium]|nr:fructosamine kinase family protein [Longimicrobiaceae bacterium]